MSQSLSAVKKVSLLVYGFVSFVSDSSYWIFENRWKPRLLLQNQRWMQMFYSRKTPLPSLVGVLPHQTSHLRS